ncbi:TraB/GumN family protein [soil metagenome]
MRQIIVIIASLLAFYGAPLIAKEAPTESQSAAEIRAASTSKQGALFRVRHAGHTLFLFGTIHVAKPDFYPLDENVLQALARSSKLALEIDPADVKKTQQAIRRYGFLSEGQTSQLAPELKERLAAALKRQNVPVEAVAQMKPWMLVVMLALNEYAAQGYQAELAVDAHLARSARAQNKAIVALESADQQISLLANLSMPDQLRMLEETLTDIEDGSGDKKIRRIIRLWREADAAGLELLSKEMAEDQTLSGRFLQQVLRDGRNPSLASGLEKLLKAEKNSLAGIGLLHLVGEGSVPALLSQRGYLVERIY